MRGHWIKKKRCTRIFTGKNCFLQIAQSRPLCDLICPFSTVFSYTESLRTPNETARKTFWPIQTNHKNAVLRVEYVLVQDVCLLAPFVGRNKAFLLSGNTGWYASASDVPLMHEEITNELVMQFPNVAAAVFA